MNDMQKLLKISPDKLKAFNSVLLDPDSQVMKDFLAVVAKYGTPQEINKKHRASRKMDNLFKLVEAKNPDYSKDLKWLIEQRNRGAFISVADYRKKVLGDAAKKMKFKDKYAVTLEVSALQYSMGAFDGGASHCKSNAHAWAIYRSPQNEGTRSGWRPACHRSRAGYYRRIVRGNAGHQRHGWPNPHLAPRDDHRVFRRDWSAQRTRPAMAG